MPPPPPFPDLAFCAFVRSILGGANWTMAPGWPSPLSLRPPVSAGKRRPREYSVHPSGLGVRCSFTLLNYATDGCLPFFFGSRLDAAAAAWHERSAPPSADTRGRFRRMLLRSLAPSFACSPPPLSLLSPPLPKVNDFRSLFPIERKDGDGGGGTDRATDERREEEGMGRRREIH